LGHYPGGARRRFERRALIGGVVFHWTRRAARSGTYRDAMKLLARGWLMVSAAITRRLGVLMEGRRPCKTMRI
jgi:hypothetical protein